MNVVQDVRLRIDAHHVESERVDKGAGQTDNCFKIAGENLAGAGIEELAVQGTFDRILDGRIRSWKIELPTGYVKRTEGERAARVALDFQRRVVGIAINGGSWMASDMARIVSFDP